MNATIYKEDSTKESWDCILNDLGLPSDTIGICVKHISHITTNKVMKAWEELIKKGIEKCPECHCAVGDDW